MSPDLPEKTARSGKPGLPERPPVVGPDPGVEGELRVDRYLGETDLTHWFTPAGRVLAAGSRRVSDFFGPYLTLVVTILIGAGIAFVLSLLAVAVYDAVADADGVAGLDRPLLDFALTLRSPVADAVITGYTDIAGTIGMPTIAVVSMIILAVHRKSWTPVVLIVAAGGGSLLMTVAGKELINRQRPPLSDAVPPFEYSPSFPSGHTLNAVVVIGIIAYLLILRRHTRRARVALAVGAAVFAITVGLSRVFLGHHWFTDVLAGWMLGAAWLAIIITAHRLYLTTRKRREEVAPAPAHP